MKPVYIILGMHRSGTSMIANILHNCGIPMGYDFLSPDELNNHGYYEDEGFLWINKGLLENCGGDWLKVPKVSCLQNNDKFSKVFARTVKNRAQMAGNRSWGWKDPRNSLTCWWFHDKIDDPKYIIVRRNRESVISSLQNSRPNLDVNWSKLYDEYNWSIDRFVRKHIPTRMEVFYDDLVNESSYRKFLRNLMTFVGLGDGLVRKAASFIHFRAYSP